MKIRITNYFDVWGNAKDGWEVNNLCHDEYTVRKVDLYNKKALLRLLKRLNYLKKNVRTNQLDIDGFSYENRIEISQRSNYCQLFAIEEVLE